MDNTNGITWVRSKEDTIIIACPICNSREAKTLLLKANNPFDRLEWLHLYRCGACESCFYEPFTPP